jgi:mono/diheme cytochrome c family protein
MSDHHKPEKKEKPPRLFGWMAEYADDNQLLDAARKVRDSGYSRTDAFAPFPIHGIDEALGIKPTVLPWFTLIAGATGTLTALTMQYWMNAVDYPYIISGKPFASWPAFIPVAFELTVLFAAYTTVFAMLGLNGLPRFSNPMFTNPKFDRATDDRFFLWVDSRDKYFNTDKVKSLLESTGPLSVSEVKEDDSPTEIPKFIKNAVIALILIALIPGAVVLRMRAATSEFPRWQVFFDMDFQPKKKPQQTTTLFADGRTQRMPVPGTVARGDLDLADPYYLGYDPDKTAALMQGEPGSARMVAFQDPAKPADGAAPANAAQPDAVAPVAAAPAEPNYAWISDFPVEVDDALFELGKKKFETNCSVCHGFAGYGDGLVAKRAANLAQGYWLQPTSMHEERIVKQTIGRIYYTVTNGKGKMAGYASSLTTKERWAVVAYVRALQRSQNATIDDVPEAKRSELTKK